MDVVIRWLRDRSLDVVQIGTWECACLDWSMAGIDGFAATGIAHLKKMVFDCFCTRVRE